LRHEDVSFRHVRIRERPEEIVRTVSEGLSLPVPDLQRKRRDGLGRAIAALALVRRGGLTQRETAEQLRIGSGSAVSFLLRALRSRMRSDPSLARTVERLTAPSLNSQLQGWSYERRTLRAW
jgi:hypothetical protein